VIKTHSLAVASIDLPLSSFHRRNEIDISFERDADAAPYRSLPNFTGEIKLMKLITPP
jgi:hypothetical protein